MRAALLTLALAGCATNEACDRDLHPVDELPDSCLTRCELRVRAANALASEHAPDCRFEPEALEDEDCAGTDRHALLSYYATWCDVATLSCIREVGGAEREELCFGAP